MSDRVEFISPAWIALAREVLTDLFANAKQDLSGVTFHMCEVFTDVPEHLAQTDDGRAGWHFRVNGKSVEVGSGEIDDADMKIIADYATILPAAKMMYGKDTASAMQANQKTQAAALKNGKVRSEGDFSKLPPALMSILMPLHNRLAERTL